jgi:hypothetical protein
LGVRKELKYLVEIGDFEYPVKLGIDWAYEDLALAGRYPGSRFEKQAENGWREELDVLEIKNDLFGMIGVNECSDASGGGGNVLDVAYCAFPESNNGYITFTGNLANSFFSHNNPDLFILNSDNESSLTLLAYFPLFDMIFQPWIANNIFNIYSRQDNGRACRAPVKGAESWSGRYLWRKGSGD